MTALCPCHCPHCEVMDDVEGAGWAGVHLSDPETGFMFLASRWVSFTEVQTIGSSLIFTRA